MAVISPYIRGSAVGAVTSNSTSHVITFPSYVPGDLLLVFFSCDGNPAIGNTEGWGKPITPQTNGTAVTHAIFYKHADGINDALTVTTGSGEQSTWVTVAIANAMLDSIPVQANGSSTNSNPAALTLGKAGTKIVFASRGGDSTVQATAPPSGYNLVNSNVGGSTNAATYVSEKTFTSSTDGQSEDPGTFTSATEQWVCFTISVQGVEEYKNGVTPLVFSSNPGDQNQYGFLCHLLGISTGSILTFSGTNDGMSQSFPGKTNPVCGAYFLVQKVGAPTGTVYAAIRAHSGTYGTSSVPTGSDLVTGSISVSDISTEKTWIYIPFNNDFVPVSGTNYCLVLYTDGTGIGDVSNYLNVFSETQSSGSASGNRATANGTQGSSWTSDSGEMSAALAHVPVMAHDYAASWASGLLTSAAPPTNPITGRGFGNSSAYGRTNHRIPARTFGNSSAHGSLRSKLFATTFGIAASFGLLQEAMQVGPLTGTTSGNSASYAIARSTATGRTSGVAVARGVLRSVATGRTFGSSIGRAYFLNRTSGLSFSTSTARGALRSRLVGTSFGTSSSYGTARFAYSQITGRASGISVSRAILRSTLAGRAFGNSSGSATLRSVLSGRSFGNSAAYALGGFAKSQIQGQGTSYSLGYGSIRSKAFSRGFSGSIGFGNLLGDGALIGRTFGASAGTATALAGRTSGQTFGASIGRAYFNSRIPASTFGASIGRAIIRNKTAASTFGTATAYGAIGSRQAIAGRATGIASGWGVLRGEAAIFGVSAGTSAAMAPIQAYSALIARSFGTSVGYAVRSADGQLNGVVAVASIGRGALLEALVVNPNEVIYNFSKITSLISLNGTIIATPILSSPVEFLVAKPSKIQF